MSEYLIKPYEISVWEDELTSNGFVEHKLAVIGSDTMTGLNKVYDPVFNKKVNGEKTLSFSLKYKYFDPYSGNSDFINPFAALLINERKVKLHYDDNWYEFIIKDHTESSDGLEWTYTCTDAFVLELSKNGYNITFDSELNNNQGTARELAEKTLENTDWQVGGANIGKQLIAELVYKATLVSKTGIEIIDTDNNTAADIQVGTNIYLFYNYIKNQNGKFVQFIIRDNDYVIDDNNVIIDTNYRIETELVYKEQTINDSLVRGFYLNDNKIIAIGEIENLYQAYRLAYGQLTTYDPVMGRTVDRYKIDDGDLEVYKYTDYTYTTSNVVTNFITNGENFNSLEDGTLQGWNPYVDFTGRSEENKKPEPLELVTRPELGTNKPLADLTILSQIEGFLKVKFKGTLIENLTTHYYENAIYNSGFENNVSTIGSVAKGDKFVFRWRATVDELDNSHYTQQLRLIVAKYTQDTPGWGYYYKHFKNSDIILQFEGTPQRLNNYITGGTIDRNNNYIIDGVPQTPSTKYIYKVGDNEYAWNGEASRFESRTDANYLPYYYLIAEASQAVSNTVLTDPKTKIGIFIYHVGDTPERTFYIQDIQLTRYVPDTDDKPITLGNIPTATSTATDYYYIKPSNGAAVEDIITYTSLEELEEVEDVSNIEPLYNENSEKNLSISASQSNCFNILQTIAETFECWVDLVVEHDERGYITYTDGKPNKYVYLKEYAGKDNYAGFKYGINLQSIERTVNSDEIVTKLIVDQSQSEYVDEGFVSIAKAPSNISGESYILNFDYYYNQGLLDRETIEEDKNKFIVTTASLNKQLQETEKQRRDLENSLTVLESKLNVFTELVETAEDNLSRALGEFEELTGETYESYRRKHNNQEIQTDDQLTEEDTIFDLLGEIYTNSATINNYSGLLTNIEQEYWQIRNQLRGSENYKVKIWVGRDDLKQRHVFVELDDYLPDFSFTLGGSTYTSTVSKKFFDITTNATTITFSAPQDYQVESSYEINDSVVKSFRIRSDESVDGIEDIIEDLQEQKDQKTKEFNNKYSRYIQEGTWNSTDYIDSEQYYLDALQVSNTSAQPTVSYTINVVEISELEGFELYTFDTGDKTYVEDIEFFGWANVNGHLTPAKEEVIISEVEWHLDRPEENIITVQNYKTRFEDLFQRISAAVQTVQYNEATYAKISSLLDANGTLNQNVLLDSLNRISGQNYNLTSDGSVLINGDQILVQNLTNPANRVIINSEGIRISSDGGNTWTTAINGQGINIGTVYTGTLNTNNVVIGNRDNPSFRWDKSGISAYKNNVETYVKTTDTTIDGLVDNLKVYYTKDENTGEYIVVENPVEEDLGNYYEEATQYDLKTYVRFDQFGLYGIKDKSTFKAETIDDVKNKAHFGITWDGFFIKNTYKGGGQVEITSENDFRVLNKVGDDLNEKIKIGALEWMVEAKAAEFASDKTYYTKNGSRYKEVDNPVISEVGSYYEKKTVPQEGVEPSLYGIRIRNNDGVEVMKTDDNGDLIIVGTIDAMAANFSQAVTVGKNDSVTPNWIIIDGVHSSIQTSDYQDGAGHGWMINKDGDAVFNNITARGAIKTAVFEYAEIQAVGGIFIFRPSSTIKSARIGDINKNEKAEDLIVTVENPLLFTRVLYYRISSVKDTDNPQANNWYERTNYGYKLTQDTVAATDKSYFRMSSEDTGSWCKVSNYITNGVADDSTIQNILLTNGLTHVYKITNINLNKKEITLEGAANMVTGNSPVTTLKDLEGGALIDLGNENKTSNYGIGVNSSDNTVNLPAKAISLFETIINKGLDSNIRKITYDYKGILGTLPILDYQGAPLVNQLYHENLEGTQGIYTSNMYIGDDTQYIAFYTGRQDNNKYLKINTRELTLKAGGFSANPDGSQNFVYLSSNDYAEKDDNGIEINGSGKKGNWRLVVGNKFGVDKAGNLYASNATIEGHIQATSGTFGHPDIPGGSGATFDENGNFIVQQSAVDGLKSDLGAVMHEASLKGYTLYVQTIYSSDAAYATEKEQLTTEQQNELDNCVDPIILKAYIYYGENDITSRLSSLITWTLKDEENYQEHPSEVLGGGQLYFYDRENAGYGATIICNLALDEEVLLTTPDDYAIATPDNYLLTAHV